MGEITRYLCSCGYEKEACLGFGSSARNKNRIRLLFPPDSISNFISSDATNELQNYQLESTLAFCPKCNEIQTVPKLSYTLKSGSEYSIIGSCPICQNNADPISNTQEVTCPKCQKQMDAIYFGHWD